MSEIRINKPAAAQRQLDAAIRMLFAHEDILAVHTIAAAAHRLLSELATARGNDIESRIYASAVGDVYQKLLGRSPASDQIERELPHWMALMRQRRNRATNFLKHAATDSQQALDPVDLDAETDTLMLMAVIIYSELGFSPTPEMWALGDWHLAVYPQEATDSITTAVGEVHTLPRSHQLEFGEFLLELRLNQSPAQAEKERQTTYGTADLEDALDDARADRTVPADKVRAWIESWDTPEELPVPKPDRH